MISFALLALSVVAPNLISPSQALLAALSLALVYERSDILYKVIALYAATLSIQAVRDDSQWWHALVLVACALLIKSTLSTSKAWRLGLVYALCIPAIFSMLQATGFADVGAIEHLNIWKILDVDAPPAVQPVLLDESLHPNLANTWLPLPTRFSPWALYAESNLSSRAYLLLAVMIAAAAFASRRNSKKICLSLLAVAYFGGLYFSPPTSIDIWMPAKDGNWLALHLNSDGGAILREPLLSEQQALMTAQEEWAVVERHPFRAPVDNGTAQWLALLELWSSARLPADHASISNDNSYLHGKRYSVDSNGYLRIDPLP
ncbi:MAG: hypothetical protein ACI84O_001076 [Myxococcota bacterium]|jgi:hypothetical protein